MRRLLANHGCPVYQGDMPDYTRYAALAAISIALSSCSPSFGPTVIPPGLDQGQKGLEFLPEKAVRGYVFKSYSADGKASWHDNWATRLDLSGVAWNDPRCATLISANHVVMAAHFIRPADIPLVFHDRDGKPHQRTVTAVKSIPGTDIAVAKLSAPMPPQVRRYPFANASDAWIGRPAIVSHEKRTVSVHRISSVQGTLISFEWIPGLNPVYGRNLIPGDSGHPSFVIKNGGLALLETHSSGGAGTGPFYGSLAVQAAVRAAMAELGN